jgi:hypothetical protein
MTFPLLEAAMFSQTNVYPKALVRLLLSLSVCAAAACQADTTTKPQILPEADIQSPKLNLGGTGFGVDVEFVSSHLDTVGYYRMRMRYDNGTTPIRYIVYQQICWDYGDYCTGPEQFFDTTSSNAITDKYIEIRSDMNYMRYTLVGSDGSTYPLVAHDIRSVTGPSAGSGDPNLSTLVCDVTYQYWFPYDSPSAPSGFLPHYRWNACTGTGVYQPVP